MLEKKKENHSNKKLMCVNYTTLHAAEAESYVSRQHRSVRHAEPKQLHICVLFSCLPCNVAFGNSDRMAENNDLGKDVERRGRAMF